MKSKQSVSTKRNPFTERMSLYIAKSPDKAVLFLILLFNVSFFMIAALIISQMAPPTLKESGFWPSVFYTVTMILDAGCISFVVEDVGQTGVAVIIVCLLIVLIGMITFSGAVIGYITNYISQFIENANNGKQSLKVSNHVVILNWNSRASEIVHDLLYSEKEEIVVILVKDGKDGILKELYNSIQNTIYLENKAVASKANGLYSGWLRKKLYTHTHKMRNNLTIIIREGDVLSPTQLSEISIQQAKTVFVLGRDYQNEYKKSFDDVERLRGNSNLIKTLILVSELTASEDSADHQMIVVEVEDAWTHDLVNSIISHKERLDKCNILAVPVNQILGKLLSQLAIMPGLNVTYRELFSNKGFYISSKDMGDGFDKSKESDAFAQYIRSHNGAIPLSVMKSKEGTFGFYLCNQSADINDTIQENGKNGIVVQLNPNYQMNRKHVIILGHNSSMDSIMSGFDAFRDEWNYDNGDEILDVVIVDDEESLKRHDYYHNYPYVSSVISANVFDKDIIYNAISGFSDRHKGDISVLILSDDQVPNEEIDECPLTYLIYMDDLIQRRKERDPKFDDSVYDIIVEILNPQNYDAVKRYNSSHVVVSNQFISQMMTQVGEHEAIYAFYEDILTFDDRSNNEYTSKEFYLKKAADFFAELPQKCTAHELVRAVYEAGPSNNKSALIGRIFKDSCYELFAGDNAKKDVALSPDDLLILCSNH